MMKSAILSLFIHLQQNSWMSQLIYWETKVFMAVEAHHESPLKTSFLFGTAVFTGTGSSAFAPGDLDLMVVSNCKKYYYSKIKIG